MSAWPSCRSITVTQELAAGVLVKIPVEGLDMPRRTLMVFRAHGYLSDSAQRFVEIASAFDWDGWLARLDQARARPAHAARDQLSSHASEFSSQAACPVPKTVPLHEPHVRGGPPSFVLRRPSPTSIMRLHHGNHLDSGLMTAKLFLIGIMTVSSLVSPHGTPSRPARGLRRGT